MVDVEVDDTALTVTGRSGGRTVVETVGWSTDETRDGDIGHVPVDATLSGHVTELRFSETTMEASALDGDLADRVEETRAEVMDGEYILEDSVSLPEGRYRITAAEQRLKIYVTFEAAAEIQHQEGTWTIRFPHPTPVTLGIRDDYDLPEETVTVPPTPGGIAAALSRFPAALRTTTPDQTFGTFRTHPPRIDLEEDADLPDGDTHDLPETGIEFRLPERVAPLLEVASPAFYLGAKVRVEDRDTPLLRAPGVDFERSFSPMPDFQTEVAELLRRVFWLDCLVRSAGPYGIDRAESDSLDAAGIDPGEWYDAPLAERLQAYLDVDFTPVASHVPDWPYAVCLPDSPASARALPFVANFLGAVYTPEYAREAVDADPGWARTPPIDTPRAGPGGERLLGWTADEAPPWVAGDGGGVPPGTFEAPLGVYDHVGGGGDSQSIDVVVVRNDDPGNSDDGYATWLRTRGQEIDGYVDVRRSTACPRDDLAAELGREADVLVYVGECADGRLACPDGGLQVDAVEAIGPDVVVVDAPGSVGTVRDLVEREAVAGLGLSAAATTPTVDPAPVGYLIHGIGVADAAWMARRYFGTDLALRPVGNGLWTLRAVPDMGGVVAGIDDPREGEQTLGSKAMCLVPGGVHTLYSRREIPAQTALMGNLLQRPLDTDHPGEEIEEIRSPIIYSGRGYWPADRFELLNPVV